MPFTSKILLLGSGELGKEFVIAAKRLGAFVVACDSYAGAPAKLQLEADRRAIAGDGRDLSFVTARVLDKDGRIAPRASNKLRFTIEGPGEIAATDNGDPTSFVPFPSRERQAFNGLALAIVRAKPGSGGKIIVRVDGDGLEPATVEVRRSGRL